MHVKYLHGEVPKVAKSFQRERDHCRLQNRRWTHLNVLSTDEAFGLSVTTQDQVRELGSGDQRSSRRRSQTARR